MWLPVYGAFLLIWPVPDPYVERGFEPPPERWAAGHRGVDLAVAPGQRVQAVGPGDVAFAGTVAGKGVVSIRLSGSGSPPLRVSYEPVRALVRTGDRVAAGQAVGTLSTHPRHCQAPRQPCLHLGFRRGERYLDPLSLLRADHPVLLPVEPLRSPAGSPKVPRGEPGAKERTEGGDDWSLAGSAHGQSASTTAGLATACALTAAAVWARRRLRGVCPLKQRTAHGRRAAPYPPPPP